MADADTYKPLKFFRDHTDEINTGFVPFSVGDVHYFAYYFGRKLILISQSYKTIPGRDNGIESVKTNMRIKERYKYHRDADSGKYYFDLIAGNFQGVAKSAWFKSELVARAMANILIDEMGAQSDSLPVYHPETFFELRIKGLANGFDTFEAEDGHYFTYNDNGKTILISLAQKTALLRDAAVDKVSIHMQHEEWYEYRTIDAYQHDFRIVDVDDTEIARSVVFGSEEAADQASLKLQEKSANPIILSAASIVTEVPIQKPPAVPKPSPAASDDVPAYFWQGILEGVFKWAMIALFVLFMGWTSRSYFGNDQNASSTASLSGSGNVEEIAIAAPEIICWDESRVSDLLECPPEPFTLSPTITPDPKIAYICGDGSAVENPEDCPAR